MKERVMVALSGGVDSAVAAYLLKEKGYDVVGVTMCLGVAAQDTGKIKCCGPREIEDARAVCRALSLSHYVLDFAPELQNFVIEPFIREYRLGRTPNPCVECNRRIKFGALLEKALSMGFDLLATGHYAAVEKSEGGCLLKVSNDSRGSVLFSVPDFQAIPQACGFSPGRLYQGSGQGCGEKGEPAGLFKA